MKLWSNCFVELPRHHTRAHPTTSCFARQTAFGAGALADGQVLSTLYAYDGDGRRVLSTGPSGRTLFVYDALSRLAAEYSDTTPPVTGAHYLTADPLGSVRIVTDDAGRVVSRHDYLPFGEEIPATEGPSVLLQLERDFLTAG